jgi:hypothetical protein
MFRLPLSTVGRGMSYRASHRAHGRVGGRRLPSRLSLRKESLRLKAEVFCPRHLMLGPLAPCCRSLVPLASRCHTQNKDHATRKRYFLSGDLPRSPLATVFGVAGFGAFHQGNRFLLLGHVDGSFKRRLNLNCVGT